jgi:hypothetical protein
MPHAPDQVADELLVLHAQAGDRRALAVLARRWERRLLLHAMRLTNHPDGAREVAQDTWLAITRRNFVVRRESISEPEYLLLSQLQEGRRIGEAIAVLIEAKLLDPEDLVAHLHEWFRHWTAAAFIIGFTTE